MDSTIRQLKAASAFVMASGVFVLLGSWDKTSGLLRLYGEVMFWPESEGIELTKGAHLLSAILGGVMFSWGLVYWLLTDLLETAPQKVKRIFLISLTAWFVTDTLGSITAGAFINVICNIGYLLIFLLPLRNIAAPENTE